MQAAHISLANMKHIKTQHYQINCNWKVFCDNYLVRLSAMYLLCVPIARTSPNSWPPIDCTQRALSWTPATSSAYNFFTTGSKSLCDCMPCVTLCKLVQRKLVGA